MGFVPENGRIPAVSTEASLARAYAVAEMLQGKTGFDPETDDIGQRGVRLGVAAKIARTTPEKFERMVELGKMPKPKLRSDCGALVWDRLAIEENRKAPGFDFEEEVYVIGFDDYVKIGYTTGLSGRIKSLQTAIPTEIEIYARIIGNRVTEALLHNRFNEYRLKGEWFKKTGALKQWIAEGCPFDKQRMN